jgi:hypothetical protein
MLIEYGFIMMFSSDCVHPDCNIKRLGVPIIVPEATDREIPPAQDW